MSEEPTLYEAMYILDASLDDEQVAAATRQLESAVTGAGSEVVADEAFGLRRLAYDIDGHSEGIYKILYFRGSGEAVDELKREFLLLEPVIRGMVVVANPDAIFRTPEPEAPPEEAEAATEAEEAPAEEEVEAPVEEEAKAPTEQEVEVATEQEAEAEAPAEAPTDVAEETEASEEPEQSEAEPTKQQ